MEYVELAVDFVLHIDRYLAEMTVQYGAWIYVILFVIMFCETGFFFIPFLPGDSMLFVAELLLPCNRVQLMCIYWHSC